MTASNEQNSAPGSLREALEVQRAYLCAYEKPCEPLAYETLRTFDDLFCRDLMEPSRAVDKNERLFRGLSTWGINHALRRIVPRIPTSRSFRDFPSNEASQTKADDFIFNCGVLALAERFEGWLGEGILVGELQPYLKAERLQNILVLKSAGSSCFDEEIGRAGLRWVSARVWQQDRPAELALEAQHRDIEPDLKCLVDLVDGWCVTYSSTRQIDDYFLEWARLYLRRIFSQDMLSLDDVIGGRPFSRYLEVLSALSARSQKHIAFAAILRARYPSVHIRNLLTTHSPRPFFIESLAAYMDADRQEIETILRSFVLTGDNLDVHTLGGEMAWAPIVQASTETLILPIYGLDINPFLFLLADLRFRYEADWFRVANNRESRWVEEIANLFPEPRWRKKLRNLRLREGGKDVTDIDFAAYDSENNELALFQLKWQHPVGMDNRGRRSAGKNLVKESNRWIQAVISWLKKYGADELMRRLGFDSPRSPKVHLLILGRYQVHLSGIDNRDDRAIWSDWAHFRRVCAEELNPLCVDRLVKCLRASIERSRARKRGESIMFPVGNIAVVVNPTAVPRGSKLRS
jgi:hypothetical protein